VAPVVVVEDFRCAALSGIHCGTHPAAAVGIENPGDGEHIHSRGWRRTITRVKAFPVL